MDDDRCGEWFHSSTPLSDEYIAEAIASLERPLAASAGHKKTIDGCRKLVDEVVRVRHENGELRAALANRIAQIDRVIGTLGSSVQANIRRDNAELIKRFGLEDLNG